MATATKAISTKGRVSVSMTNSESKVILESEYKFHGECSIFGEALITAIKALKKQEKIKEIIDNANQWSKEDVVVKAQAFCDIEKIVRSDTD